MFNWETFEPDEYSRGETPSFVDLTERSYITATGHATDHTADESFLSLARAAAAVAKTISGGPETDIPVKNFKGYVPYPVQAVWQPAGDGEDFKIWIKQPLFIDEAAFNAAIKKTDLGDISADQIHFEHLAEGIEIQTISNGPVTVDGKAAARLNAAIKVGGFKRLHEDTHREVYIDGLPLTASKQVILRFEIDPNGAVLDMVHN